MTLNEFFEAIRAERGRQDKKFPNQKGGWKAERSVKLNVLIEEILEMQEEIDKSLLRLVRAVNDELPLDLIETEGIQAAAVIAKWFTGPENIIDQMRVYNKFVQANPDKLLREVQSID